MVDYSGQGTPFQGAAGLARIYLSYGVPSHRAEPVMGRILPVICLTALLLGGCKLTESKLSPSEETALKTRLVEENETSITVSQRSLFLQKRFGTEEEVREALDRMVEANEIRHQAAMRKSSSVLENNR